MPYHKVTELIKDLLIKNRCWFETFEHEAVRTSEQAAKTRQGYTLAQGAKAIILRVKKSEKEKKFVMLILPGHLRFASGKVKKIFQAKDIRFASEEEISLLTGGVQIGGVPPFGNLFNLEVVSDPKLFENEKIVFNAGDPRFSIAMNSDDYRKLVNPQVTDIVGG